MPGAGPTWSVRVCRELYIYIYIACSDQLTKIYISGIWPRLSKFALMLLTEASNLVRCHARFCLSMHNMMASHIPAYLFVKWEEEKQHSVIDSKRVKGSSFKGGERVTCKSQDGEYYATILGAGNNACVISPYPIAYTDDFRYQDRSRLKWRKWSNSQLVVWMI